MPLYQILKTTYADDDYTYDFPNYTTFPQIYSSKKKASKKLTELQEQEHEDHRNYLITNGFYGQDWTPDSASFDIIKADIE